MLLAGPRAWVQRKKSPAAFMQRSSSCQVQTNLHFPLAQSHGELIQRHLAAAQHLIDVGALPESLEELDRPEDLATIAQDIGMEEHELGFVHLGKHFVVEKVHKDKARPSKEIVSGTAEARFVRMKPWKSRMRTPLEANSCWSCVWILDGTQICFVNPDTLPKCFSFCGNKTGRQACASHLSDAAMATLLPALLPKKETDAVAFSAEESYLPARALSSHEAGIQLLRKCLAEARSDPEYQATETQRHSPGHPNMEAMMTSKFSALSYSHYCIQIRPRFLTRSWSCPPPSSEVTSWRTSAERRSANGWAAGSIAGPTCGLRWKAGVRMLSCPVGCVMLGTATSIACFWL